MEFKDIVLQARDVRGMFEDVSELLYDTQLVAEDEDLNQLIDIRRSLEANVSGLASHVQRLMDILEEVINDHQS